MTGHPPPCRRGFRRDRPGGDAPGGSGVQGTGADSKAPRSQRSGCRPAKRSRPAREAARELSEGRHRGGRVSAEGRRERQPTAERYRTRSSRRREDLEVSRPISAGEAARGSSPSPRTSRAQSAWRHPSRAPDPARQSRTRGHRSAASNRPARSGGCDESVARVEVQLCVALQLGTELAADRRRQRMERSPGLPGGARRRSGIPYVTGLAPITCVRPRCMEDK